MAKGEKKGFKSFIPGWRLVVKIAIVLVILRLVTRYVVLPYQASLPAVIRDNWPTPA